MIKHIQKISRSIIVINLFFTVTFALPSLVYAEDPAPVDSSVICKDNPSHSSCTPKYIPISDDICKDAPGNPACTASADDPITGSNGVIMRIANVTAFAAGVLAVIMLIFAGFRLAKSGGDTAKIAAARETIIYSLVGIVVIVSARLIIGFVISKL